MLRAPFRAQGSGHLVMISSVSAMRGMRKTITTYAATKAGVAALAEGLLNENVKAKGIDVSIIYPGYIMSEMNEKVAQQTKFMVDTTTGVRSMVNAIEKRKVEIARKEHARPAVEKLAAEYHTQKLDLQDGIRVDWAEKRAWLHVRASNTEPIMRLIAEAPTAPEANAILDEAAAVIAG